MSGVSAELIENILSSHDFQDGLYVLADHTVSTSAEGAFAVYSHDDTFTLSELLTESTHHIEDNGIYRAAVNVSRILQTRICEYRDDVALDVRSHPDVHIQPDRAIRKDPKMLQDFQTREGRFKHAHRLLLAPTYDESKIHSHVSEANPGHVSTILTAGKHLGVASLLLYRHESSDPPKVRADGLDSTALITSAVLARMTELEFSWIAFDFSLQDGRYDKSVDSIISALFSPKPSVI